jgi:hypothetical protein
MATRAAQAVVGELGKRGDLPYPEGANAVADIVRVSRNDRNFPDGYEMARDLEKHHYWSPDSDVVEKLDRFGIYCADELDRAVKEWVAANPMEPPFAVGAAVTTAHGPGIIEKIHEHRPGAYVIKVGTRSLIIAFEDVTP